MTTDQASGSPLPKHLSLVLILWGGEVVFESDI